MALMNDHTNDKDIDWIVIMHLYYANDTNTWISIIAINILFIIAYYFIIRESCNVRARMKILILYS